MHGKIFPMRQLLSVRPPLHPFCRCKIRPMNAITSGYATTKGTFGADYWLKNYGKLPVDYVTKVTAERAGWIPREGNLDRVLPGKIVGGDEYSNRDGHLPSADGRTWYEADLNYYSGRRNGHRLVWSNDGLFFVTYDHYESFIEVAGG